LLALKRSRSAAPRLRDRENLSRPRPASCLPVGPATPSLRRRPRRSSWRTPRLRSSYGRCSEPSRGSRRRPQSPSWRPLGRGSASQTASARVGRRPEVVALAKALARKKPKGGKMSLREVSAAMAAQGFFNEGGSHSIPRASGPPCHVAEGWQAIVGNVSTPGGGRKSDRRRCSHKNGTQRPDWSRVCGRARRLTGRARAP
jgi:hypothetical protein